MKQLLFWVIALLFIGGNIVNAQMNIDSTVIHLEKRKKPTGTKELGGTEASSNTRNVVLQPAYAYIYNQIVFVSFPYETSSVVISLTNLSTGEVIYSDTYASPSQTSFDLSQEGTGEYYLEIVFDDFCIYGQFTF